MKKTIAFLLSLLMLLAAVPVSAETEEPNLFLPWFEAVESFDSEVIPLYYMSPEDKHDVTVWYINGEKQIPYISLGSVADVLGIFYTEGFSLNVTYEAGCGILTRENGSFALIDPATDYMWFFKSNLFKCAPNSVSCIDLIDIGKAGASKGLVFGSPLSQTVNIALDVDLSKYAIDIIERDGEIYLPLQTFFDFFVTGSSASLLAMYNGKCIVIGFCTEMMNLVEAATRISQELALTSGTELVTPEEPEVTLMSLYMETDAQPKSENLIKFNFNELCAALDSTYGLQKKHGITSFKDLFVDYDLMDKLWSAEPKDTFNVLNTLASGILADGHSMASTFTPYDADGLTTDDFMVLMTSGLGAMAKMGPNMQARAALMGDDVPAYYEIGNTAYITFDSFMGDPLCDYFNAELKNDASDTIVLLMYANEQLHRENCPIENVVIDLSNNGGGAADAAACVISFVLGRATLSITDNISGAKATTVYHFDANRDGEFDTATDSIAHLNRYCLTGAGSFSCGNLVPAAFKASNAVTLIGRTTGGGACAVCGLSTADGNAMVISSPYCINTLFNGTYYDVDAGIVPDIYVSDLNHLYDRQYLTDFINGLM